MRALAAEDKLLHEAAAVAIESCERINFAFNGIVAYRALVTKLRSFHRTDLQRQLKRMNEYPELRDKWLGTVIRLNAEQFFRHLQRVDDLWRRMTVIHGIEPDIAWDVLIGYPDADPGTTRQHTNAVLMINAAILKVMVKSHDFTDGVTVPTTYNVSDESGEHMWSLHALTPEMISFALERVEDTDEIVALVLKERLLQPEALRFKLDGSLPTTGEYYEVLANSLTISIYSSSADALTQRIAEDVQSRLTEDQHRNDTFQAVRRALMLVSEARRNKDTDALKLHAALVPSLVDEDSPLYSYSLHSLVKALRDAGHHNVMDIIDERVLENVRQLNAAFGIDMYERQSALNQGVLSDADVDCYEAVLLVTIGLGPEAVNDYLSDHVRAMNLVAERGIRSHTDLIATIEEILRHGVLSDGLL